MPRDRWFALAGTMLAILLLAAPAGFGPRPALALPILTQDSFDTPPLAIGGSHFCVLPGDGTVVCWGNNTLGQIGKGEFTDPALPTGDVVLQQVVIADEAANGVPECEDRTADGSVVRCRESASLTDVTAIAAGFTHTCALLEDSTVRCWGSNAPVDGGLFGASLSGGELGDGTTVARPFPAPVIAGPGQAAALSGVRALTAATGYTCALMEDATAKCWGNAPQATSTAPVTVMADASTPLTQIAAIAAGDQNACATLADGSVVCWGTGILGDQLWDTPRDGTMPVKVTVAGAARTSLAGIQALALGHNVFNGPNGFAMGHSCGLTESNEVRCWGWNDVSQLGNGFNALTGGFESQRDFAVPVIAAPGASALLSDVTAIAAGGYATCALIDDGSVKCWGLNFGGESFEGAGAPVPLEIDSPTTVRGNDGVVLAGYSGGSIQTAAAPIANVVAIAGGGEGGMCAVLADGGIACQGFAGEMAAVPGVAVAAPAPEPAPTPNATPAPQPSSGPGAPTSAPGGAEAIVGSWDGGSIVITYADGVYSISNVTARTIPGSTCVVPAGTVLKTFSETDGEYRGQELLWHPADCTTESRPVTFIFEGDRLTIVHELTGVRDVLIRSDAAPLAGEPKTFRSSIPTPGEINLSPAVLIPTLIVAGGLIILVPFPGALFNSTLEANYSQIMGGVRRARRRARNALLAPWSWLRRMLHLPGGPARTPGPDAAAELPSERALPDEPAEPARDFWWTAPGVGVFILLTVLLSGFLDPSFGLNLPSVATFAGMLIGLLVLLAAFDLPLVAFYRRKRIGFWLHALPPTIAVAIACILISRLTDFHPGYLYGLIIASFTVPKVDKRTQGKLMAAGVASSVIAATVAWFALGAVRPMTAVADPGPLLITVETALSMVVAAGVELAAVGMLPLTFLVGKSVYDWNKLAWGGIWAVGLLAFGIVILNPQNGYLSDTTRTPFLTVVALLAVFGLGSVLFWFYFHRRRDLRPATPG